MKRPLAPMLRSLALLAPFATSAALPACDRVSALSSPEPDPRPQRPVSSPECPPSAPASDAPCAPVAARCHYREPSAVTCLCESSGRWQCATMLPTRGPLPPPELAS